MYHLIKVFRVPLYEGVFPGWIELAVASGIAIITLVIGWLFFAKKADEFTYQA
jgi:ABC-type polysaccharide/polyol phosphate export permease